MNRLSKAALAGSVALATLIAVAPSAQSAAPWTTFATVSDGANSVSEPQVSMAAGGLTGFALWQQSVGGHTVVRASRFANGTWAAPVTVTTSGGEAGWPRLAASSDGTSAWAAWAWDVPNPGVDGVQVARWSGGSWSAPTTVSTNAAAASAPEVATGTDGSTATVIFRESGNGGLRYRVRSYAASTWSSAVNLAADGAPSFEGRVAQSGDGSTAVAVWSRGSAGSEVIQTSRRTGGTWSSPADLSTSGGVGFPKLSLSRDGATAATVWINGTTDKVWLSRFIAGAWTPAVVVSGTDAGRRAVVAASSTGSVLVGWIDATDAVRVRRYAGGWLPSETIDSTASDYVSVSMTDDGRRAIAAWDASTGGSAEVVRARRLTDQAWGAVETIGQSANGGFVAGVAQSSGGTTTHVLAALGSTWVAQASRSIGGPSAPRSVTVVRGDALGSVSWAAPSDTGGLTVTSYTATASPGGKTCTTAGLTCTITGLANGTPHTVTVTATTSAGTGLASASSSFTPATVPGAPTAVKGTTKPTSVTATWTAPASTGGAAITQYTAIATPGGRSCTTATTSCSITGLTNGKAVRITVTARNAVGSGPASAPSAALIPWAGTIKVAATGVLKRDKLHIDVGPDRAKGDYPVVVLRRRPNGSFTTFRKATAAGKKEIVLLQLPAGRYKVKVPARFGWKGVVSGVVILVR